MTVEKKVVSLASLKRLQRKFRAEGKKLVFSNGTFDILHRGHVEYLDKAKRFGDVLVIGLNTNKSIRRIKGPRRPVNPDRDRAIVLAALESVDYVCFFDDDTPIKLIKALLPDVLVKGADWKEDEIVGKDVVQRNGGVVKRIRLTRGRSTTTVIERVLKAYATTPSHRRQ